ncbi:MAG: transglutaminase family protein [Treponema sp.]|jgi:transglutaminase-like putative cysteine protease|nr:transglutaminase family protein [Treponema sp.]
MKRTLSVLALIFAVGGGTMFFSCKGEGSNGKSEATVTVLNDTAAAEVIGHKGTVTFKVELLDAEKARSAKVWLPYPLSDASQTISNVNIKSDSQTHGIENDPKNGAVYLVASWENPGATPTLTLTFDIDSHYKKLGELREVDAPFPPEVLPYLEGSEALPLDDPLFADVAGEFKKEKSILKRARLVYDWVIENTFRDNSIKGCGLGLPVCTLADLNGAGKCADISSVYLAVARASGIPARDVYGLRMASPKNGEITGDFHCWLEFYLPGTGWTPIDPADVRKAMLTEELELKDAGKWVEFFWGGDKLFRIALNRGARDMILSEATEAYPLTYFMYPYAEVNGEAKDFFSPADFKYTVTLNLDSKNFL